MADLFAPVTLGPLLPTTTPLEPDLRQDGGSDVAAASTLAPAPQSDLSALELVGNFFSSPLSLFELSTPGEC